MAKRLRKNYGKRKRLSRLVSFFFFLKRNHLWLRRFAFLWLLIIVLEIACPLAECKDLTDLDSHQTVSAAEYSEKKSTESVSILNSDINSFSHIEENNAEHCKDECLCHVSAILGLKSDLTKIYNKYSPLVASYQIEPIVSISPPSEPPKTA